jgi:hypothetical protein
MTMSGQSPGEMMQTSAPRLRRTRLGPARQRRWPILAPVLIVIVVAVAWSWLWYEAAAIADRTLAGWVEREAAAGRLYSCATESITGFPLGIQAHCSNAAAAIRNSQPPYALQAAAVNFSAAVYRPTRLLGEVVGPVSVAELGQPPSLSADWKRAQLTVSGVPPNPDTLSIVLDAPRVDRISTAGATGAPGTPLLAATRVDLRGRIVGGSPGDHPVIELTVRVAEGSAPTFHPALAQPLGIELDMVVRGFKDLAPKPWAERFREMQAAGGGIEVKAMRLTRTDAVVLGAGSLTVNANGKLDGLMRVAIAGLERVVPLLGIDRMIAGGVDQLAGSSGTLDRLVPGLGNVIRDTANANVVDNLNKMGEQTSIDNRAAVVLPLRFVDGAVYLGMLRIGELPPLF